MSVNCDCPDIISGLVWPAGSNGDYPPELPYVEKCDNCGQFADDESAADALVDALEGIGWTASIATHTDDSAEADRPHIGTYVIPIPPAEHRDACPNWQAAVELAKRLLEDAARNAPVSDATMQRRRERMAILRSPTTRTSGTQTSRVTHCEGSAW